MVNTFQIEQAILNVINNALEAMHSDGQLTVKTRQEKRSGTDFIVIEIGDTGPGMAQNIIDRLSLSPKDSGRGFGLFITREILQYYGGHLEIKSIKGQGSTVLLYLPIKRDGGRE
jgi:signal transduction histidine kinase